MMLVRSVAFMLYAVSVRRFGTVGRVLNAVDGGNGHNRFGPSQGLEPGEDDSFSHPVEHDSYGVSGSESGSGYGSDGVGGADGAESEAPFLPTTNYTISVDDSGGEGDVRTMRSGKEEMKYVDLGLDEFQFNPRRVSLAEYFFGNNHHTHHVFYNTKSNLAKQAKKVENRSFVDLRLLRISSGKGGNGCVAFFRDANAPVGPPDGGDGGDGGNVYINVVNKNLSSLHKLKRTYEAKPGTPGKGSQLDGKRGDDVIIEVPVGTTIRWIPDPFILKRYLSRREGKSIEDIKLEIKCDEFDNIQFFRNSYAPGRGWIFKEKDEEYQRERDYFNELNKKVMEYDYETIASEIRFDKFPLIGLDLDKPTTKPLLLLKGGKGGLGNMHFLTKDIRNPRFATRGRDGLTEFFLLELKLIADLGLVGLPNAGKSTLLRAISRATPRVGHWEFTTLQPTVGTIFTSIDREPFTVADIPGIIKGASENKGMGLDFLRHIERSGGLVFVVSLESKNSIQDLETLLEEVGPKRMENKKVLVVATKADLTENGQTYNELRNYVDERGWKIVPICAIKQQNIDKCIALMREIAQE